MNGKEAQLGVWQSRFRLANYQANKLKPKQKRRPVGGDISAKTAIKLFDFCFLEIHVLFRNRIIFAHRHFLGHRAAVFLGDVVKTGVCGAQQFYLDCGSFRHGMYFR